MADVLANVYGKTKPTIPQSQPVPGKNMVQNNAGGYGFDTGDWQQMQRWLILGSSDGTYYVGKVKLTRDNAKCVERCIQENGVKAVQLIVDISTNGRAPKNDYCVFALGMCVAFGDQETRSLALANVNNVCRTGTHLFAFMEFLKGMRSTQVEGKPKMRWNRSLRRGLASWYLDKEANKLAYQMLKYQSRRLEGQDSWSHSDILRETHAGYIRKNNGKTVIDRRLTPGHRALFDWSTKGFQSQENLPGLMLAFEELKGQKDPKVIADAIQLYGLTHEMIPTEGKNSPLVWEALLQKMPLMAIIRNLGKMTSIGLLTPFSDATKLVYSRLSDQAFIHKSRVHPLGILTALMGYKAGQPSMRVLRANTINWTPVPRILDVLDKAFYMAFQNAPQTNLNYYVGLDCSSSMGGGEVGGVYGMTPIIGGAAMAMVLMNREPFLECTGYASGSARFSRESGGMKQLGFTPNTKLDQAVQQALAINWGGTDCSLPVKDALARKLPIDVFVNITDNESWAGSQHPYRAIEDYRQKTGRNAHQIMISMTATDASILDPSDPRSMEVVGFDTNVPPYIADFVTDGKLGFKRSDEVATSEESE